MRFLVDTNVFLDFFFKRDVLGPEAKNFFAWCAFNKNRIYITSMSLRDIGYIAHRFFHDEKRARKIQIETYCLCSKVLGISTDAAIESLYSDMKDYEDSLLAVTAKLELLDAIITNNKKDFLDCGVPVFTPAEIVKL